jgi:acyl-homoserine-lactone acylase
MSDFEARRADGRRVRRPRRLLAVALALVGVAASTSTAAGATGAATAAAASTAGASGYKATIVRTSYGIPHITADNFGSLGYGYGYAFASDDLCTMADDYITVEGQRSRYFGPDGSYTQVGGPVINNLDSDLYWHTVIDAHTVQNLLAATSGPGALKPQVRQLIAGYVAGYDGYLASVGGANGVPDPTCRGKAWVKPITSLDAYLRMYQLVDIEGSAGDPAGLAEAQPPAASSSPASSSSAPASSAASAPSATQIKALTDKLATKSAAPGSNALAIGSAGARGQQAGLLLGNPHFPWDGPERFYEVQMTIPGVYNVEGATLYGEPIVVIGFNSTVAWTHTDTPSFPETLYQLTLVPGHPTEYLDDGRAVPMAKRTVTVFEQTASGIAPVTRTLWSSRWGSVVDEFSGFPLSWTGSSAYVLADADANNFRFLNDFFATDEATSTADVLAVQKHYEGMPWVDTVAADSTGHALYTNVGSFPDVTDALAAQCDTPLGAVLFEQAGLPVLDGSRSSCAWGTDPDSAAPGIFGSSELPVLARSDFVENSNDSFWLTNPAQPLTGFSRILGSIGTDRGLRTRSALAMVTSRISGTDGLGPAGFTLRGVQNLMFSDIEYGATLVKPQLVAMCRSLPGGLAPTDSGAAIAVGDACNVLAAWNGREDPDSRGAVLFRDFWERALSLPEQPWAVAFDPADPVNTPNGLNVADSRVRTAFGDALADLTAAHLPYNVALGARQYVVRDGRQIPIPGGPGDPDGEFNAIYQNVLASPGVDPVIGSSYIQAVTWDRGSACPDAATLLTYSESANPDSPHYADQTRLFSEKKWVTAAYCADQVRAQAVSVQTVYGR